MRIQEPKTLKVWSLILLLLLSSLNMLLSDSLTQVNNEILFEDNEVAIQSTLGRTTTTWSGTVTLNQDYFVGNVDELIINACTQIFMDSGTRIYVDGRLIVQGTKTCPVVMENSGNGNHEGIVFNQNSSGRGSLLNNLTIINPLWGITMFGGDAEMHNITINNADYVGIDLFDSASPRIYDLNIQDGGQDLHPGSSTWRYGIGISVGNYSAPIFENVVIDNLITRGFNFWGNSGGVYRNVSITNITGAIQSIPAGIWMMDSIALFDGLYIDRCDNGFWIRHFDDSVITRAVVRDAEILNSKMYGIKIDKYDPMNYTNYVSGDFDGLIVKGTGGPNATTQGQAVAAIEVNTSGAIFENVLIEDNSVPGFVGYLIDSTTLMKNAVIKNSGKNGGGERSASILLRSTSYAPQLSNIDVSNSPGYGIMVKNGAGTGSNWNLHNNSQYGLYVSKATVHTTNIQSENNGWSGIYVYDSRNVILQNVNTTLNGDSANNAERGSGYSFYKSNDVQSNSGNVSCFNCTSINDAYGGFSVIDSIDLELKNISVFDPRNDGYGLLVDNSGLLRQGSITINEAHMELNRTGPIVSMSSTSALINDLTIKRVGQGGTGADLFWDAEGTTVSSSISDSHIISDNGCMHLVDHINLNGENNICESGIILENSNVNFSGLKDGGVLLGSNPIVSINLVDGNSLLHLHNPIDIDFSLASITSGSSIEEAYDINVQVVNQNQRGVPFSSISVSFNQFNTGFTATTSYYGSYEITDYISRKWTNAGSSSWTEVTIDCDYTGTSNSTGVIIFNNNKFINCYLDLANQPPFIIWDYPEDNDIYPSGSQLTFNASSSWDLDNDILVYTWTSDIDGDIYSACFVGDTGLGNQSFMSVNDPVYSNEGCLSDGEHAITLEICDGNYCVSETRIITLTNLPPIAEIILNPSAESGVLTIPWTQIISINASGTTDPEGNQLDCDLIWGIEGDFRTKEFSCLESWNITFSDSPWDEFDLKIVIDDGVIGNLIEWEIDVNLYNELPVPSFNVSRDSNYSEEIISFNASNTFDAEGDEIQVKWSSNIDGILLEGAGIEYLEFGTKLTQGVHLITLSVSDDILGHQDIWAEETLLLDVENSPPKVLIQSPNGGTQVNSSDLIYFSALGSGDWDAGCDSFSTEGWYCNPVIGNESTDVLSIEWSSNLLGILNSDWWFWSGRLTAGNHLITLKISDGVNDPVTTSVSILVGESAPTIIVNSPVENPPYLSSEDIKLDLSSSLDYDGDEITYTLLLNDIILFENANPSEIQALDLDAGNHLMKIIMSDNTGKSSITEFLITVLTSKPNAIIDSPDAVYRSSSNSYLFSAGQEIWLTANSSTDADEDIESYLWMGEIDGSWINLGSESDLIKNDLAPGVYSIKLRVTDKTGEWDEIETTIEIESSRPKLTELDVHPDLFNAGEAILTRISVRLLDPDKTTNNITAKITLQDQTVVVTLNDNGINGDTYANDGIWTAETIWAPKYVGYAEVRIIAMDVDDRYDEIILSPPIQIVSEEMAVSQFLGSSEGMALSGIIFAILFVVIVNIFVQRRRKKFADMDVVESWGGVTNIETIDSSEDDVTVPKMLDLDNL